MKTFLLIITCLIFKLYVNGQITLEHKYDSASTQGVFIDSGTVSLSSQLMIVKFEVSGERFVNINRAGKNISIYDLNHSLIKTVSLSGFPMNINGNMGDVLYLSEQLFDTDTAIEFMYLYNTGFVYSTAIYKENGSLIFSDTLAPAIKVNYPLQQYPIYNTIQGAKMILSCYSNGQAWVFSLPGTLSTAIAKANGQLMQAQSGTGQFSGLYPNPSNGAVTLQYELPKGEQYGEIILYDTQGAEVKRYKVDNTFNDILLDNTMLPAGTYFYQLTTKKGIVGSKKMVVIK